MADGRVVEPLRVEGLAAGFILLVSDGFGVRSGLGCSQENLAAVDQQNMSRPFVVVIVCCVTFCCG